MWVEGSCCPLAGRGYSRDGRKGKLHIEYGLLSDPVGRRVAIRVFCGNSADPRSALGDRDGRFDDLFNLMIDPAFLLVAWDRVRGNTGAKTAGVDGRTAMSIALGTGVEQFLDALRSSLKQRRFRPCRSGSG